MTKRKLVTFHIHSVPGPHTKVSEHLYERLEGRKEEDGALSPLLCSNAVQGRRQSCVVFQVLMNRAPVATHARDHQHNTPMTPEMEAVLGGLHWKPGGTAEIGTASSPACRGFCTFPQTCMCTLLCLSNSPGAMGAQRKKFKQHWMSRPKNFPSNVN